MPIEPHGLAGGKCYATPDGQIRKVLKIVGDDLTYVSRTSAPSARAGAGNPRVGRQQSRLLPMSTRVSIAIRSGRTRLSYARAASTPRSDHDC
jgi:hypothetical protein